MAIVRARHSRRRPTPPPVWAPPSAAQIDQFLAVFEETLSLYEARKQAKISRDDLKRLLETDSTLSGRMKSIQEDNLDRVEDAAYRRAILAGDKDMITLILTRRRAEIYGQKATIRVEHDFSKMNKEQLQAFIEENSGKK